VRRHPRIVLLVWLLLTLAGLASLGSVFSALREDTGASLTPAARTAAALREREPVGARVVVLVRGVSPEVDREVRIAAGALQLAPNVASVTERITSGRAQLGSSDGSSQLIVVDLRSRLSERRVRTALALVRRVAAEVITGAPVLVGGEALVAQEAGDGARRDLLRGEAITLPIALALLLAVFGGLIAAAGPVLVALATVSVSLLALVPLALLRPVSSYTVSVMTMFGLALGVDYGLLLLSRFREERHAGAEVAQAVERSQASAGRTVTFSALTLIAVLAALVVVGDPLLTSLALGGILVVISALVAARTLIPALLLVAGHRVSRGRAPSDEGRLAVLARLVVRRRVVVGLGVTAVLVSVALPALHARIVLPDFHVLPRSSPSRQVAQALLRDYPGRYTGVVTVLAGSPDPGVQWREQLGHLPGVISVQDRPGFGSDVTVVDLHLQGDGQDGPARSIVRAVRADSRARGFPVGTAGPAASLVDYEDRLADRLPAALLVMLSSVLLLLFLMTGSVVLPVKAVAMALLSLTATVGVLVWGFQDGHLTGEPLTGLSAEVPLVIFVFAFGLSLDYEAFLLGRVREVWLETGDNDRALTVGLQRTAGVITSAAMLVVVVFLGFATGEILTVQEMGVGLAVAVVVDATVVRCLLVPAFMAVLGHRNWWAPAPLRRFHDWFQRRGLGHP
jgi:RND superfamily putative drug exporter